MPEKQNFSEILEGLKMDKSPNPHNLVGRIAVFADYYEFFDDIGDEPIKQGYEKLIKELLLLAGISEKDYIIKWEGIFDNKTIDDRPRFTLSRDSLISQFNLEYQGESVDTKNLLPGLNAFIKICLPDEKRKFQELQIYPDQTSCIWFVTEYQLKELCLTLHARWKDFSDHCCAVTRAETLKNKGMEAVLELSKRSIGRELKRLGGKKWEVYPAKNIKNEKIKSVIILLILILAMTLAVWKGVSTYKITGCIDFFQQAKPLLENMPRNTSFTASDISYECSWNKRNLIMLMVACFIVGWRASKKWKKIKN